MIILVIQYNFRRRYKSTMMELEIVLSIRASIIVLQKLFIINCGLCYSAINFYESQKKRSKIRVMIAI